MIKLLDYFEDSAYFYVVTKYVPQGDLYQYVLNNWKLTAMPESIARNIFRQIVKGIKALHERNILHRDIKEANVLV